MIDLLGNEPVEVHSCTLLASDNGHQTGHHWGLYAVVFTYNGVRGRTLASTRDPLLLASQIRNEAKHYSEHATL